MYTDAGSLQTVASSLVAMMLPLLCLLLVSVAVTSAWPYDHVLVNTANGPVQGDVLTLHTGDKINTFLGIPYAEPPVGARRWAVSFVKSTILLFTNQMG